MVAGILCFVQAGGALSAKFEIEGVGKITAGAGNVQRRGTLATKTHFFGVFESTFFAVHGRIIFINYVFMLVRILAPTVVSKTGFEY